MATVGMIPLRKALTLGSASVLIALSPVASGTAAAAPDLYETTSVLLVRTTPSTDDAPMGRVSKNELVRVLCQERGESVNRNRYWNFIEYEIDKQPGKVKRGYVSDAFVSTGVRGRLKHVPLGNCGAPLTQPGAPIAAWEPPTAAPPLLPGSITMKLNVLYSDCQRGPRLAMACFHYQTATVDLAGWPRGDLHVEWIYTWETADTPPRVYYRAEDWCANSTGCTKSSLLSDSDSLAEVYHPLARPRYCVTAKVSVHGVDDAKTMCSEPNGPL